MTTTSGNGPFVTSSAPQPGWASRSSPNRSLPESLFLSSAAKQSLPKKRLRAWVFPLATKRESGTEMELKQYRFAQFPRGSYANL